jgi:hypothetical protein
MTLQYTGTPYGGQNNLTLQGCFHAMVTHGQAPTKAMAATALKLWTQRTGGQLTREHCSTQAQALAHELETIHTQDRTMMAWALTALRQL